MSPRSHFYSGRQDAAGEPQSGNRRRRKKAGGGTGNTRLCSSGPCVSNATCIETGEGGYLCICPHGYAGDHCLLKRGACLTNSVCNRDRDVKLEERSAGLLQRSPPLHPSEVRDSRGLGEADTALQTPFPRVGPLRGCMPCYWFKGHI
ncbi:Protein lin-12 [Liparis tanakae]|uniref:Protein lin-12 n=1 Tax=Liparis tanakae TaxID=230148 RepID=A0A4Z2ELC5_9TELE|nr:Protein lin-12 [Liparis tanakae]